MEDRFKIVTWHGESRSLWYVVDAGAPYEDQPAVMDTHYTLESALKSLAAWNLWREGWRAEPSAYRPRS